MKKTILSLSFIVISAFAVEDTTQLALDTAVSDAQELHTMAKERFQEMSTSEAKLEEYEAKLEAYEVKVSAYLETGISDFANTDDAEKAMNTVTDLSREGIALAKVAAALASAQGDNMTESYQVTLQTLSQTTLRLSDDIGAMADRIGEMADRIGVMADRIVETQEIQSANLNAMNQTANYAMTLANGNVPSTQNNTAPKSMNIQSSQMPSGMQGAGPSSIQGSKVNSAQQRPSSSMPRH